jgi:hypothetical protein
LALLFGSFFGSCGSALLAILVCHSKTQNQHSSRQLAANRTEREREEQQRGTCTPHPRGRSSRATEGVGGRGMSRPAEGAVGDGGVGLQKGRRFPLSPARCASASLCLLLDPPLSRSIPPLSRSIPFSLHRYAPISSISPRFPPKNPANCPGRATQPPVTTPRLAGRRLFFPGRAPNSEFLGVAPRHPLQRDPMTRRRLGDDF